MNVAVPDSSGRLHLRAAAAAARTVRRASSVSTDLCSLARAAIHRGPPASTATCLLSYLRQAQVQQRPGWIQPDSSAPERRGSWCW